MNDVGEIVIDFGFFCYEIVGQDSWYIISIVFFYQFYDFFVYVGIVFNRGNIGFNCVDYVFFVMGMYSDFYIVIFCCFYNGG